MLDVLGFGKVPPCRFLVRDPLALLRAQSAAAEAYARSRELLAQYLALAAGDVEFAREGLRVVCVTQELTAAMSQALRVMLGGEPCTCADCAEVRRAFS
jgi:hypothetical protein